MMSVSFLPFKCMYVFAEMLLIGCLFQSGVIEIHCVVEFVAICNTTSHMLQSESAYSINLNIQTAVEKSYFTVFMLISCCFCFVCLVFCIPPLFIRLLPPSRPSPPAGQIHCRKVILCVQISFTFKTVDVEITWRDKHSKCWTEEAC